MSGISGPVALIILDGWGLAEPGPGNAVSLAHTPVMDGLLGRWPHTRLSASGLDVGLPSGQMGNSEVGHTNLGAGRVVRQYLPRIDLAIEDGSFFTNPVFEAAASAAADGRLHLLGLCSEGGIHASLGHLLALLEWARRRGLSDVVVHAITDGRDTPPDSASGFLHKVEAQMARTGVGRIATVSGRYYAMDRDKRWDRTEKAYRAMVEGKGPVARNVAEALAMAVRRPMPGRDDVQSGGESDEFVTPTVIGDLDGRIRAGDAVIAFNWRSDRMRQIVSALTDPGFSAFARPFPQVGFFAGMAEYEEGWKLPYAFPPLDLRSTIGETVSAAGRRQLRVAETEKYAHVTYFFNGGAEEPFPGEERILVPSPKVATYDLAPEMSASEVAARAVAAMSGNDYALVVLNFANPDMVGHTGVLSAAQTAVEAADHSLGQVLEAVLARRGVAVVLADHGNAECMIDPATGGPHTAHTVNPVPAILVGCDGVRLRSGGRLADVAPTLLGLIGLEQPPVMDGRSLIGG